MNDVVFESERLFKDIFMKSYECVWIELDDEIGRIKFGEVLNRSVLDWVGKFISNFDVILDELFIIVWLQIKLF